MQCGGIATQNGIIRLRASHALGLVRAAGQSTRGSEWCEYADLVHVLGAHLRVLTRRIFLSASMEV